MGRKAIAYTLLIALVVAVLPLASGIPFIGPTEEAKATILDSVGVAADDPDNASTTLRVSSHGGGKYAFVKIGLPELPPIDEIFIVSAYLSFHIGSWSGSGVGGYAGVATHHCEDDSWSGSTLTWNNKPEHREPSTDTWGFAIIHYGDTLGFTIEDDVEETLRSGDTVLTEVITWGAGSGTTTLSSPTLTIRYVRRPVYKVFFDSVCDVPDVNVTEAFPRHILVYNFHPDLPGETYASPGTYDLEFEARCKFLEWQTSEGVSVSNPLEPSTEMSIESDGQLVAACSLDWVVYGAESDKPSSRYSGVSYNASEMSAVALAPVVSGYLRLLRIYILENVAPFEIHFMGMTEDPEEEPPVDIADPMRITPTGTGWVELDLTPHSIEVERDARFYIVITWLEDRAPEFGETSALDSYDFTNNTWDRSYDDILLQVIVSRDVDEPVEFVATTTATTTTTKETTSPTTTHTPTTTRETTVVTTTTTPTTPPPPPTTTIETTLPTIPTTPTWTTVTTTPRTTTSAADYTWAYGLIGLAFIVFVVAVIFFVIRSVYRRATRKPGLEPEARPPSPPPI